MKRILNFSGKVELDKVASNYYVTYLYEQVHDSKIDCCNILANLYIVKDNKSLKGEVWDQREPSFQGTIIQGKRLVQDLFHKVYPTGKDFNFTVDFEKYMISRSDKIIYISKDIINNTQHVQYFDKGGVLPKDAEENISLSFQEIEAKYL